jgi:hypothetical protein
MIAAMLGGFLGAMAGCGAAALLGWWLVTSISDWRMDD